MKPLLNKKYPAIGPAFVKECKKFPAVTTATVKSVGNGLVQRSENKLRVMVTTVAGAFADESNIQAWIAGVRGVAKDDEQYVKPHALSYKHFSGFEVLDRSAVIKRDISSSNG